MANTLCGPSCNYTPFYKDHVHLLVKHCVKKADFVFARNFDIMSTDFRSYRQTHTTENLRNVLCNALTCKILITVLAMFSRLKTSLFSFGNIFLKFY